MKWVNYVPLNGAAATAITATVSARPRIPASQSLVAVTGER
jgi:hypothetical protein